MEIELDLDLWVNTLSLISREFETSAPNLLVQEECESTMELGRMVLKQELMPNVSQNGSEYCACFSLSQTKGRGRKQRVWHSTRDGGIYLTLADNSLHSIADLEGLSLVVGLAVLKVVRFCNVNARLKWANDILVNFKKISGILIETVPSKNFGKSNLLIGVGLNYGQDIFPEEILATSIVKENGSPFSYEEISIRVVLEIIKHLRKI